MNPRDQPPEPPRWLRILRLSTELTLLVSGTGLAVLDTYDRYRQQDHRPFGHPPVVPRFPNQPFTDEEDRCRN
jgi:hypothetical protein